MQNLIKSWQIIDGTLHEATESLSEAGLKESYDLESWIASNPLIIGTNLVIIGRQVQTLSGPLDLLAVDHEGNLIIVELKRDRLPREALAQAIDYASDVSTWNVDRVREICLRFTGRELEEMMSEEFPEVNLENLTINSAQNIILVGFSIEPALERMVSWLSETFGVTINAVVLHYTRTSSGDEILSRTMVLSEDLAERRGNPRKFKIPMSDEPGAYDDDELRRLLLAYLSQDIVSARRIREIVLPLCLQEEHVDRDRIKQEFVRLDEAEDMFKAGLALTVISGQLGMEKNDFLRQVIGYEYPNNPWEKDNYHIRAGNTQLVRDVLQKLGEG